MDQCAVATFAKDQKFEGFLLVRSAEQRASSNGSRYLDMNLCDRTGEINAKLWDGAYAPPKAGSVVKVRALVTEYNGRLQLRINKLRDAEDEDNVDMSLLIPCAPYPAKDMRAMIDETVAGMKNEVLQKVILQLLDMAGEQLAYFPAAQKLHHAERSGLLHHTTTMLKNAKAVLQVYSWLDADLLYAGVIAHDLSKIAEMKSDEAGNVNDYTTVGLLLGHLVHGVSQVAEAARRAGIEADNEYVLLLEHMVISHHGEAEFGSPRPPMFPEAEMLHWLDVLDARMNEMNGIVQRTPAGAFSERIWSLERRIYHPHYLSEMPAEAPEADERNTSRPDADTAYQGLL
ncbi:MAG: TraI domain-containing protein [Clostridia bacterium]|nr:TraI domain-containing protein [Clostridia bacterium]